MTKFTLRVGFRGSVFVTLGLFNCVIHLIDSTKATWSVYRNSLYLRKSLVRENLRESGEVSPLESKHAYTEILKGLYSL